MQMKCFQDCQQACGMEPQVRKHCPTRWLSLCQTCDWVLKNWKPLEMFFEDTCKEDGMEAKSLDLSDQKRDRKRKVFDNIKSRAMKLYIKFLTFVLPIFDKTKLAALD